MVVIIRTFIKDYKNFLEYIVSWMTGTMDIIFEFPCTMTMTLDSTTIIIFIGHVIKFLFVYVTDFLFFFCISFLVSLSKVIFLFSQSSLFLWRALENIARYLCVNCLIIFILQKLVKQKENYLIASEKLLRKIK